MPLFHELTVGRYFASLAAVGSTSAWTVVNTASGILFAHVFPVPRKMRFDRIGCMAQAGAEGFKVRLGVYDSDGSGKPNALLLDSGDINVPDAGLKEAAIDLTLDKGLYFIAFMCNYGAEAINGCLYYLSPLGGATDFPPVGRWERDFTFGPLPNPFGSPNANLIGTEILAAGLRLAELL